MAVYTQLTYDNVQEFLTGYDLGELVNFKGIANGITNTNYFIITTKGQFVLTIFENTSIDDIMKIVQLLAYLEIFNLPIPKPLQDYSEKVVNFIFQKPAFLCSRLTGESVINPTMTHCQQIGKHLAELHQCTHSYDFPLQNSYNLNQLQLLYAELSFTDADKELVIDELYYQSQQSYSHLPSGVIHSDLFRDNVLFENDSLTGIVDFHSACFDILLWDIAVAINDWCIEFGKQCFSKYQILLNEYQKVRPLSVEELKMLPSLLRLTALRFWLSRIRYNEIHFDSFLLSKNPDEYKQLLIYYRQK